jgi:cytoskeletal protein CcmA (bactofilin family)
MALGGCESCQENRIADRMFAAPRRSPLAPRSIDDRATLPASHLGRALTVYGRLESGGEIHVHGNVMGRIDADRLVIAHGGCVEGDVVAREVHVSGRLTGRIFAVDVTLEASAEVKGRVFHHTISVAKGAHIDGRMPWRPPNYFESLDQLPEEQP